jgi:hypothetical protein
VLSGQSLRARSSTCAETELLYLRFAPSTRDGFYSVSEPAVYCRARMARVGSAS